VKIDTRQIPDQGLILTEEFNPAELDLDTGVIKFCGAIKAKALISKSYDAIGASLSLNAPMLVICSRCLREFNADFNRQIELHYAADKLEPLIDLDPDIREEIILSYPINPLCSDICKGLCPRCGCNLNEGGCNCGST